MMMTREATVRDLRVYFDINQVALGTIDNFYGDYYANEDMKVVEGFEVVGKTYTEIRKAYSEYLAKKFKKKYGKAVLSAALLATDEDEWLATHEEL
jgi:predicted ATP-dependent protease